MSGGDASGGFPGLISPFNASAFGTGLGQSAAAMANRYGQLGLSGSTAEGMDLGVLPSVTGGIPAEFEAGTGEVQTQDLGQTLQLALSNLGTSSGNKQNLLNTASNIFSGRTG